MKGCAKLFPISIGSTLCGFSAPFGVIVEFTLVRFDAVGCVELVADGEAVLKSNVAAVAELDAEFGSDDGTARGESQFAIAGVPWPRSCMAEDRFEVKPERFWKLSSERYFEYSGGEKTFGILPGCDGLGVSPSL